MRSGTLSLRAHRSACLAATLFASLGLAAAAYAGAGPLPAAAPQFDNPAPSPDGGRIALTDAARDGLYIYDAAAGTLVQVAGSPSGGYAYNWSADGARIVRRGLHDDGDRRVRRRRGGPACRRGAACDVHRVGARIRRHGPRVLGATDR